MRQLTAIRPRHLGGGAKRLPAEEGLELERGGAPVNKLPADDGLDLEPELPPRAPKCNAVIDKTQ
jgi:hypothetical protein